MLNLSHARSKLLGNASQVRLPFFAAVLSVYASRLFCQSPLFPNKRDSYTGDTERTQNSFCQSEIQRIKNGEKR